MLALETETEFGSAYLTSMENNGSNGFKITLLSHRDQIRTSKALSKDQKPNSSSFHVSAMINVADSLKDCVHFHFTSFGQQAVSSTLHF